MATLHSRYVRGALVYWDTHRKRLVDAIGSNVIKYSLQPGMVEGNAETTDPAGWTATVTEVGTSATTEFRGTTEAGAVAELITGGNENDGGNWQLSGESFEFTSDQDLYFGCEFKINDVTQSDLLMGLCITDTTLLGGMTDGVYFETLDGNTTFTGQLEKDSTETTTSSLVTLADNTYVFAEFYWDGSGVEMFVNGSSVATPATTNLPDNEALRLSLAFLSGEAASQTCTIRQLRVIQIGR